MNIPPNAVVHAVAHNFGQQSRKQVAIGNLSDDSVAELKGLMRTAPFNPPSGACFAVTVEGPRGNPLFGGTRYVLEDRVRHTGNGSPFPLLG